MKNYQYIEKDGVIQKVDRKGSFVGYDLSKKNTFGIFGGAGSGMNFFVQDLITNALLIDKKVHIIDIGSNYTDFVKILNGNIINISGKNSIESFLSGGYSLSPDDIASVTDFIKALTVSELSFEVESELRMAIIKSFSKFGNDSSLETIYNNLSDEELKNTLFHFIYSENKYGSLFNNSKSDISLYDFEDLDNNIHIRDTFLVSVINKIKKEILSDTDSEHLIVINELWNFLYDSKMIAVLNEIKDLRSSVCFTSLSVSSAKDIYSNLDFIFSLSQGNISDDNEYKEFFESIERVKVIYPEYKNEFIDENYQVESIFEVGIINNGKMEKRNLFLDSEIKWFFTNHPTDREKISYYMDKHSCSELDARIAIGKELS